MATSQSSETNNALTQRSSWASWLGIVAVVLGVLLTAEHGNEWMKQVVITQSTPVGNQVPPADCPRDELAEENLSFAECEQMVSNIRNFVLAAPTWFPHFQATLAAVGTVTALLSIVVGAALVNYRRWAAVVAIVTFGALTLVDIIGFVGAVNTGPLLREVYLWDTLLWFFIHLMMTVGVAAGRSAEA